MKTKRLIAALLCMLLLGNLFLTSVPAAEEAEEDFPVFIDMFDEDMIDEVSEESDFYGAAFMEISDPADIGEQEYPAEEDGEAEAIIEEAEISEVTPALPAVADDRPETDEDEAAELLEEAAAADMAVLLGTEGDSTVYTVTLLPGEEADGTPQVYEFTSQKVIPTDWHDAQNCQFYINNGNMCFKLDSGYNPFTAHAGYEFDGWTNNMIWNTLSSAETTFTAKWREDLLPSLGPIAGIPVMDGGTICMGGIEWRVIGMSDDAWLLISADVLGERTNWESAKNYCETVYGSSLSAVEQNAVKWTTKEDGEYKYKNSVGDDTSFDAAPLDDAALFLLSTAEANWYFSGDADRQPGEWWLRSSFGDGYYAGTVDDEGDLGGHGVDNEGLFGVRPAFQLNLESVLFSSAAEGGKSSAAAGSGEFASFLDGSGSIRKLTLIDSSRSGFTASPESAVVLPGGNLPVTYTGAGIGDNEFVSAILCDAGGNILYYASRTPDASGSGTWNMTLPDGLTEGSNYTLKVFSERQNGDNRTDYAGSPVSITLAVRDTIPASCTVTVLSSPEAGGTVSGGGEYDVGASVTVTAEANAGYEFQGWYDGETLACKTAAYTFTAETDRNLTAAFKTVNADVTPKAAKIVPSAASITTTYNVSKKISVVIKDQAGQVMSGRKVSCKMNGKTSTGTTDAKGSVTFTTNASLVPKTYTVTFTCDGLSATVKLVVKKAAVKLTSGKKTFKVKTKTKKYTVTLKDNKGRALKKVKLTLKVNGKTYKATTNAKGKATFKITKLSKKRKYTATVKYAGNKYYNNVSKKIKLTIR